MTDDLTLSIDLGTSSVRAALVDRRGKLIALASRGFAQTVPRFGWAEQSASAWWEATVAAIREVLAGNSYMSAAMHEKLARALAVPRKKPEGPIASLSEREFEVLHLIGLGFSTREIAEKLNRSVKTIEAHQANIREKLNIRNGKELTRFAIQWIESQ